MSETWTVFILRTFDIGQSVDTSGSLPVSVSSDEPSSFGAAGMVGDRVIVTDSEDVGGNPKARYRDSSWVLESSDDLIEGDRVEIIDVRGATLIVKKENQV